MERSGFFNSSSGDRVYDATDFAAYFGSLVSNGIFYANTTNLQVTPVTGMIVSIATGSAWINGYRYENTEALNKTLATANGSYPRIDRIIIRWSFLERRIIATILTGTAAATPTAPTLTRNAEVYELCLADVLVPQAATSITTGNITDTRLSSSLCGTVNSLVTAVYE
ncbi:hypothetical protein [Anaerocolumna sp. MB42-C2]|uniref:hypothetical protein n=1 Tax=Anaerocolumna sp. MB42-C2 TaxID=3070997 RepID=UPI0027DFA27D|nr:hypothetical protein [Anaerocolumna sp. MB42-C2]WMJ87798.1 hypothetical protein RBU59_27845 [Anaerocolumna sp. MB42-C2]